MSTEFIAVLFLGIVSIILASGILLYCLAHLGYNTYLKFQDRQKKIEVHAKNSNHK